MTIQLGLLDYIIFFGTLVGVMLIGFLAGRKDKSSEDYFLAGRSIRWFGVAGSIFGSNVSANHMTDRKFDFRQEFYWESNRVTAKAGPRAALGPAFVVCWRW